MVSETYEAQTVEDLRSHLSQFGIYDYIVFVSMLLGCAFIGIYSAFRPESRVGSSPNEYLLGGRNMRTIPVGMSLVASFISGITLLGAPTETYVYGTEYTFVCISVFCTGLIASHLILPVFHQMQLSSTYEYLQKRFDKNVRLFGSLMFALSQICWLPIVIYVPALAFNQVTGVSVHIVASCVCVVCIFYTCMGGIKAVVWTDVVQTLFMLSAIIMVSIKGSLDVGGFKEVWQRNHQSGRLVVPTFDPDFTIRHTFWAITVGGMIQYIQEGMISQIVLQRYLSLRSLTQVRCAMWIFVFGTSGFILLCSYAGLVIYATFHDCDPLTTQLAKAKDQLLPLLVMKVLSEFRGLPGLFIAGIFSASLSSLSTGLNSMSAVVLEDFVKMFVKKDLSNCMSNCILRGTVLVFGALSLFLVVVVEKLGTVLQLTISLGSMTSGPVFGIFFCGLFLPWVNAKGALFGGLLGLFGSGFVIIGAQNAIADNKLTFVTKPTSVEGCLYYYNVTMSSLSGDPTPDRTVFPLFKMSYFWYTAYGGTITVVFALIFSAITGFTNLEKVDSVCFSPIVRGLLPKLKSQNLKRQERELVNMLKKDNA